MSTGLTYSGVLPYAVCTTSNLTYVLLGRERSGRDAGLYSSFGGSPDHAAETPADVAAREAFEELHPMGRRVFNQTSRQLAQTLSKGGSRVLRINTESARGRRKAHQYLYRILFDRSLPADFRRAIERPRSSVRPQVYEEKDRLAWVPVERLSRWDHALRPAFRRSLRQREMREWQDRRSLQ